jgi:hypothetical protein
MSVVTVGAEHVAGELLDLSPAALVGHGAREQMVVGADQQQAGRRRLRFLLGWNPVVRPEFELRAAESRN